MAKSYIEEGEKLPQKRFNIRLPYPKMFRLKCLECTFGRSKKKDDGTGDNPMLTRRWEVTSPESVNIKDENGEMVPTSIQGLEVNDWLTMSAKTGNIVKADSERLGVEIPDDELPNVQAYIGKEANAVLRTNVVVLKDADTGEPLVDGKGEPCITYQHNISQWFS